PFSTDCVSGNPRLKVLPAGVLRNLINLSSLSLRSNGLQDVGFSFQRTRLEAAGAGTDLAGNELSWLPAGTFQGLGRLRTLRLDGNPLLRLADKPCIALCSLTSLRTLKFDAKLGKEDAAGVAATICNRIALNSTGNVRLLMQAGVRPQPLKLNCPPGNGKKQEESLQQQQAQSHPNMALLIIFGAICLAHLAVTIALACVCWRAVRGRRHQNWRHRQADQLTAPAACVKNLLTSDEIGSFGLSEKRAETAAAGLTTASTSSESAAAVLISFALSASDARAGEKDTANLKSKFQTKESQATVMSHSSSWIGRLVPLSLYCWRCKPVWSMTTPGVISHRLMSRPPGTLVRPSLLDSLDSACICKTPTFAHASPTRATGLSANLGRLPTFSVDSNALRSAFRQCRIDQQGSAQDRCFDATVDDSAISILDINDNAPSWSRHLWAGAP
uniref:LRRCT domain-containing protein n=1 Tax=Macrostomum lignano TaxID=282301 RepID=A0A1I8FHQ7_9PLAT